MVKSIDSKKVNTEKTFSKNYVVDGSIRMSDLVELIENKGPLSVNDIFETFGNKKSLCIYSMLHRLITKNILSFSNNKYQTVEKQSQTKSAKSKKQEIKKSVNVNNVSINNKSKKLNISRLKDRINILVDAYEESREKTRDRYVKIYDLIKSRRNLDVQKIENDLVLIDKSVKKSLNGRRRMNDKVLKIINSVSANSKVCTELKHFYSKYEYRLDFCDKEILEYRKETVDIALSNYRRLHGENIYT